MSRRHAVLPIAAAAGRTALGTVGAVVSLAVAISCANPTSPAPRNDNDIVIAQGAVQLGTQGFNPNPLVRLASGARITWVNRDVTTNANGTTSGTVHRVISDEGLFDAGSIAPDSSFSFTFPGPGTYHYHCLNHPGMTGTITIR